MGAERAGGACTSCSIIQLGVNNKYKGKVGFRQG